MAHEFTNPSDVIQLDNTACLNEQVDALPYNRNYEIHRDLFTLTTNLLGQGEFGSIFKGEYKSTEQGNALPVAIKMPKGNLKFYSVLFVFVLFDC